MMGVFVVVRRVVVRSLDQRWLDVGHELGHDLSSCFKLLCFVLLALSQERELFGLTS